MESDQIKPFVTSFRRLEGFLGGAEEGCRPFEEEILIICDYESLLL